MIDALDAALPHASPGARAGLLFVLVIAACALAPIALVAVLRVLERWRVM